MAWVILVIAGLFETAWALFLKESKGLTRPVHTIAFLVCLAISMVMLGRALKTLPVGTAYAVWTGIGAVGAAIFGIIWFDESRDVIKLVSLALILAGIGGLGLSGGH